MLNKYNRAAISNDLNLFILIFYLWINLEIISKGVVSVILVAIVGIDRNAFLSDNDIELI